MTAPAFLEREGKSAAMAESSFFRVGLESTPQVSVIIPTYNRAQYIEESIRSVLVQSYTDLEVVVVDDGSVDDTEKVVSAIADPRLRYIRQENRGRSNARNHALSLARGKYVAFLDSDDLYLPGKIELQVDYLKKHPNVGMVYTSAYCINDGGEMLADRYEATVSGRIYEQIAFFTPVTITLPTVMTYREVMDHVGGFDENMHRFEDTDMWRRISKSYRIDAMSDYTCKLRTHDDNSLWNQNPAQIIAALDYYAKKIMRDDREIDLVVRKKGLVGLYRYYGNALMTVPEFSSKGKKLLWTAFAYESWSDSLRRWSGSLIRLTYYRTLNFIYSIYSKVKKIF
jgi:glycosyltransferase involved in cell wall biosynthesis